MKERLLCAAKILPAGGSRRGKGRQNMNSQLSERIRQHSANFSKGQRMIARYIEEHSDQVAFNDGL